MYAGSAPLSHDVCLNLQSAISAYRSITKSIKPLNVIKRGRGKRELGSFYCIKNSTAGLYNNNMYMNDFGKGK